MKNLLISVSFSLCLYDVKKILSMEPMFLGFPQARTEVTMSLNWTSRSSATSSSRDFATIIVIMSKLSLGFLINSKKSLMFLTISMHQNYHTFIFFQASSRKRFMDPSPSRKVWESDPLKAYALRLEQPGIQIAKKKEYLWKTPTTNNRSQTWEINERHTYT